MAEEQKILPTTEQDWNALVADLENRLQQSESERLRLQDDLSHAQEEARLLIQHAPTAIYEIDFQGPSFKSVNDAMCLMSGYTREELLAKSPFELLDEESQIKLQERYRQNLTGENVDPSVEYRVRTKDGRIIFASMETTFMFENGRPTGALVIAHDVTERKRILEEIKESERKYRELIQYAPVGIYEVDFREQKFTSVNDAMCLLTGYSRDELMGKNPLEILDEQSRLVFKERIVKWLAGEKPEGNVEYRALAKDGHEIYAVLNVTFTADSSGRPLGATVIGYDITERKHAEQALAKSQERYRTLVETSPDAIFVHANSRFLFANTATLHLFGAETFEQLSAHTVLEVITPADRQLIQRRIRQTLAGSKTPRLETRIIRLDGREVPIEAATSLIDYQGQQAIQVMVHDISDRKQAEEALRQSQQKYATILQTVESGFWLNDLEGKLLEVNEAYCRMSGYSRDELLCMNISDLEAKETAPEVLKHIRLIKTKGHHEFETIHKRKDGSIFDVDIRASYLKLEGDRFVVFAWDISDRKKMEQQLREINEQLEQRVQRRTEELQEALHKEQTLRIQLIQAEKYAALARLVGSVAHEINNPLQTIQNSLFLLKSVVPEGEMRDILDIAVTENKRMSNIVQQLRETYRPANAKPVDFDLIELMTRVSTLLAPQMKQNNVLWEIQTGQERIIVHGIPDQIQQVCLNICLNAIDAMSAKGGKLSVTISLPQREKVCISFQDTGPGIPEEYLTRIFEPFFSTKEKGTGLGLAISYEILKDHGGEIRVESCPGSGATFTVGLPVKSIGSNT